ncbi:MAG: hypothetical protein ACOYN5_10545, partial [Bacteroidales bacterium]
GEDESLISQQADVDDALIIEPCFIAADAIITNAVIGPFVSVGSKTVIRNAIVRNSVIQEESLIENSLIENSLIGNYSKVKGSFDELSLGDYSQIAL